MHCHLVAIKVSIKSTADQWMQADGVPLDEPRLEGLNAQAMQGRGTIEQHHLFMHAFGKQVPHQRVAPLDEPFGMAWAVGEMAIDQLTYHKGLEEFECQMLWQSTFMQLQIQANTNDTAS